MKIIVLQLTFFICLAVVVSCGRQVNQSNPVRQPVVAGSFYAGDAPTLNSQLKEFYNNVEDKTIAENLAAIIVPHAGYVYSAQVAAAAYAKIDPEKDYERIFIIGSSHHVLLNGASIYNQGDYLTPLGKVSVDIELANKLINENRLLSYTKGAHDKEHSIEVQLPFLQYRLKKPFKIVPIIIGTQTDETCKKLAEIFKPYFIPENLFIISSDFSHYPSYEKALTIDQATGQAVASNSPDKFIETLRANELKNIPDLATSCCGWSSVLTLLNITSQQNDIGITHVKYMNSGDTQYGDKNRVVGYHAFVFTRSSKNNTTGFTLSDKDKKILLKIARQSIEQKLQGKSNKLNELHELSENLKVHCGAFVTLNIDGQLRGCIGRFSPNEPLYEVVHEMAQAAAFSDPRFNPVTTTEMSKITIEISVLTPLKPIASIDEFKLGKQGIYIIKGNRSGTFLPQVAASTHWNKEEFLGHCARDKAGIGWDGWKDAELYTYEAVVFDEKELLRNEK